MYEYESATFVFDHAVTSIGVVEILVVSRLREAEDSFILLMHKSKLWATGMTLT